MRSKTIAYVLALSVVVCAASICGRRDQGIAEPASEYVGAETCQTCHKDMAKKWALTQHRRTLFNTDPSRKGCEACHGPGKEHSEDPSADNIVALRKLKPEAVATICLRCHTQEHVTLWRTSMHARAKLGCINCHDPHNVDPKTLAKDIENGKLDLEGLTRAIHAAELEANTAPADSAEKTGAQKKIGDLKQEREKLLDDLKGQETAYRQVAEPYICYNCHKSQEMQTRMPVHHPIQENKMKCTDCHNPHGGPLNNMREESVNQTCFRCHAEKEGPFVFEHPPVAEDCTICHNPHGSVQNNLLVQSEPFLCLRCHAAPHSRSNALGSAKSFATYYSQCTNCHAEIHGSDEHPALHY